MSNFMGLAWVGLGKLGRHLLKIAQRPWGIADLNARARGGGTRLEVLRVEVAEANPDLRR